MQSHFSASSEDLSTPLLTFPLNGSASLGPQGPQETLVVLEAKIAVSTAHYFRGGGGPLPSSQLELSRFCIKVWIPEF